MCIIPSKVIAPESRIVILARHGELHNPEGIVYNRDADMRPKDIMHLSEEGHEQMRRLAENLVKSGFRVTQITASPQTRTQESAKEMGLVLKTNYPFQTSADLDDAYVPGPYKERMKIKQLREENVDYYDPIRWAKYNHERPEQIIKRMTMAIWNMADGLEHGSTGILVSHGDPIAWAANYLLLGTIPEPKKLRDKLYPTKGQALMLVTNPLKRVINNYTMIDNPKPGNIY